MDIQLNRYINNDIIIMIIINYTNCNIYKIMLLLTHDRHSRESNEDTYTVLTFVLHLM